MLMVVELGAVEGSETVSLASAGRVGLFTVELKLKVLGVAVGPVDVADQPKGRAIPAKAIQWMHRFIMVFISAESNQSFRTQECER
jgi:hypothetical protein